MGVGGGAEEQVIRLAYAFKARGWETLLVSMLPPSKMPPDFPEKGIPLQHLGMTRATPDPRGLFRLARMIREFQPDVVHSHMVHANLAARCARLLAPFPVLVCTLHNLTMAGVARDHTTLFENAHWLTDKLAERTTAICHAASEYYIQQKAVPASKMMTVPNGIDSDRFSHNPEVRRRVRSEMGIDNDFVWLAVGRLELQKAYPTMLRAFAQMNPDRTTLLICGQGTLKDQLIEMAAELGIGDRVRFLGLRGDIPALMSAADAFVLSSDMEGLPLVLLQASAASLPIVSTNVAGNPEVAVDGLNACLVPPGAPDLLAQQMARVAGLSPADRAAMGEAGLARLKALFQIEPVVDRWQRLFEQLLEASAGRPRRRAAKVPPVSEDAVLVDVVAEPAAG